MKYNINHKIDNILSTILNTYNKIGKHLLVSFYLLKHETMTK